MKKLNENTLRNIIRESLQELDWKTYANAAKKAHQWRKENPFKYDRNRGYAFDRAAADAFNRDMDIDNTDISNYGGERGNINFDIYHGEPELTGSRNHDFNDKDNPFDVGHNVYHMGKKYGKDGEYGRARMWDISHNTTPEEFYGNDEMGKKFRDAEAEVDAYNRGDYGYSDEKGWHLNERQLKNVIRETIIGIMNEGLFEDLGTDGVERWTAEEIEDCYTNNEICDLFEKLLGVNSVDTQNDWDGYLTILADELSKKGMNCDDIDALLGENNNIE